MLPWIQTAPSSARTRRAMAGPFPRRQLAPSGSTSIQANTFPSGHAAEGLAAALLVAGAGPTIVTAMLLIAVAISAGAVLGRYHYAADAIAGWVVALVVWWLTI